MPESQQALLAYSQTSFSLIEEFFSNTTLCAGFLSLGTLIVLLKCDEVVYKTDYVHVSYVLPTVLMFISIHTTHDMLE